MTVPRLSDFLGRFIGRTNALVDRLSAPLPPAVADKKICEPVHADGRMYLVVRLLGLWGEFCKQIVIHSAVGGLLTLQGRLVDPAPGIRALADTDKVLGPLGHAPWHQPATSVQAAKDLNVRNYREIDLGLGAAHVTDIVSVRHYIVHPNQDTRRGFLQTTRNLGLVGLEPAALVTSLSPGGATLFEEWVIDLQTAGTNAIR